MKPHLFADDLYDIDHWSGDVGSMLARILPHRCGCGWCVHGEPALSSCGETGVRYPDPPGWWIAWYDNTGDFTEAELLADATTYWREHVLENVWKAMGILGEA